MAVLHVVAPLLPLSVIKTALPAIIRRMSAVEMSVAMRAGCPSLCGVLLSRLPDSLTEDRAAAFTLLQALARDISADVREVRALFLSFPPCRFPSHPSLSLSLSWNSLVRLVVIVAPDCAVCKPVEKVD